MQPKNTQFIDKRGGISGWNLSRIVTEKNSAETLLLRKIMLKVERIREIGSVNMVRTSRGKYVH